MRDFETSGQLPEVERRSLEAHLSGCHECRRAMRQFSALVESVIPTIASEYLQEEEITPDGSSLHNGALADLLRQLAREDRSVGKDQKGQHASSAMILPFASSDTGRHIWTLYAASILLFVSLGVLVYRLGVFQAARKVSRATRTEQFTLRAMQERLSDAEHEYEAARIQLSERNGLIADLRHSLKRQAEEMSHLKLEQQQLEGRLRDEESDKRSLLQERSELAQKNDADQAQVRGLQEKLGAQEKQASEKTLQAGLLETEVHDLAQSRSAEQDYRRAGGVARP
jgi:DNA repair exonuclease SbcCD ATPase subunit